MAKSHTQRKPPNKGSTKPKGPVARAPRRAKAPPKLELFLSCEHAGNDIPPPYKKLFAKNQGVLRTHRGVDHGAFAVARELERLNQTKLYYTKISRLIVDMNRSPDSETVLSRWTKSLDRQQQAKIFHSIYEPYRHLITSKVRSKLGLKNRVVHIAVHSFSPYLDPARKSCDIGILFDPESRFETDVSKNLRAHLRRLFPDLGIRLNFPYRGDSDGLTTDLREKYRPTRYAGIEIEFNQSLLKKIQKEKSLKAFCLNFSTCLKAALSEV